MVLLLVVLLSGGYSCVCYCGRLRVHFDMFPYAYFSILLSLDVLNLFQRFLVAYCKLSFDMPNLLHFVDGLHHFPRGIFR